MKPIILHRLNASLQHEMVEIEQDPLRRVPEVKIDSEVESSSRSWVNSRSDYRPPHLYRLEMESMMAHQLYAIPTHGLWEFNTIQRGECSK
jgi:hypothetical protein